MQLFNNHVINEAKKCIANDYIRQSNLSHTVLSKYTFESKCTHIRESNNCKFIYFVDGSIAVVYTLQCGKKLYRLSKTKTA